MIIFDLDGTLADCEHRRHFVDAYHPFHKEKYTPNSNSGWKADWKSFYEACDQDQPIEYVRYISEALYDSMEAKMEIWSGRCESVRKKTEEWLCKYMRFDRFKRLKMRPIGDNTPDEILKERWLDEALAEGKKIDMVFDDRPKVVRMWRRRGIFVFDCNQSGKEF